MYACQRTRKSACDILAKRPNCVFHHVVRAFIMFLVVVLCTGTMTYLFLIDSEISALPPCALSLKMADSADYLSRCNGKRELCAKPYNLVAFATMHNAFATTQDGFIVAQHRGCIQSALLLGVRGFMLDLHLTQTGEMKICHMSCTLGSLSLQKTLDIFRDFMMLNPREIVTIFWEAGFNTRQDIPDVLVYEWDSLFAAAILDSRMQPLLYAVKHLHPLETWPSLSTMIDNGQRLVMFCDLYTKGTLRGINRMKYSIAQTPYNALDKKHLSQACEYVRGVTLDSELLVINHFTMLSTLGVNSVSVEWLGNFFNIDFFKNVNKDPYFSERVFACARKLKKFPTFVVVDFWESSDVLAVVDKLNNNSTFLGYD